MNKQYKNRLTDLIEKIDDVVTAMMEADIRICSDGSLNGMYVEDDEIRRLRFDSDMLNQLGNLRDYIEQYIKEEEEFYAAQ